MSQTLTEIAKKLKEAKVKVQLIYAFNGSGKTRLSNIFTHFLSYTSEKQTPSKKSYFSEVAFSFENENIELTGNIKISKGEVRNFIWSTFYTQCIIK